MVGIDGSAGSRRAFRVGVELANLCDGVLYGVAVLPERGQLGAPFDGPVATDTQAADIATRDAGRGFEEALEQCAEICAAAQVKFVREVLVGDPVRMLTREAEGADLLVIGAQGQRNDPSVLLGNTAARVLRHSVKPVLIARGDQEPIQRVLVGYDGTPDSGHAVEWAADFAAAGGWQVRMVTGAPTESALATGARRAARIMQARGLEPEVKIVEGDAPTIIFTEANDFGADLIVIGAAPKGPVTGFFIGEAWPDVAEQAKVSVLCWR